MNIKRDQIENLSCWCAPFGSGNKERLLWHPNGVECSTCNYTYFCDERDYEDDRCPICRGTGTLSENLMFIRET